jgi:uncharacterized protein YigE (DUF2233 family)
LENAVLHVRPFRATTAALVIAFTTALGACPGKTAEGASICTPIAFEEKVYTVCEIDLRHLEARLFWKDSNGLPYGFLSRLPQMSAGAGSPLLFATNAGMFQPDYSPAGLYVENRQQLFPVNTKGGYGNFHKKPNGVLYVSGRTGGVLETRAWLKQKPKADFATQSGPMLVIDGQLHPRFSASSTSVKRRDGIGARNSHTLVFAISDQEVTFIQFARLFRDRLKCPNALFLDGGSVPTLYQAETGRGGNVLPMGPMLAVFRRPSARPSR